MLRCIDGSLTWDGQDNDRYYYNLFELKEAAILIMFPDTLYLLKKERVLWGRVKEVIE